MEPKQAGPFAADKIELHPCAWERFRQAVHVMAKAGPQHRIGGAAVKSEPEHNLPSERAKGSAKMLKKQHHPKGG
jgi:hypothetical protein